MENSDSETGVFDWSVGTIVWVRRRNGSWWPGKILGADELSASHVMSPRSGTPVKLLGREDASVDWYNLEKSKRVKPFRCGEFDDCIEKAEASHGLPPKKREKYARREDAILHALELEKQLNEKKHGKGDLLSDFNCTKLPDAVGKEAATSSHRSRYGNGKHVKSGHTAKGLGSGTEEKKKGHRGKEGNHSMDDDSSGGQPRMRGLQDLGLRSATSRQKHSSLVISNGLNKHALDDGFHAPIDGGGLTTENMINVDPKDVLDKRKRSHDVEEPLGKRRDKRRPLVQVLESSAKLQPTHSLQPQADNKRITPIMLAEEATGDMRQANRRENVDITVKSEGSLDDKEIIPEPMKISTPKFEDHTHASPADGSEENTSGSTEDTETDSSGTDSLEVGADDVMIALSDEAAAIELIPKSLGRSESQQEHGIMSNEEPDDLGLPDDMSPNQFDSTNVTVSKWQLKGKRNNRSSTKRYRSMSDRKFSKGVNHGMRPKEEGNYGGGYCDDDADPVDKNLTCMVGYGSRGLDGGCDITNWEDLSRDDQPALRGCWEDSAEYYEPVFVGRHFSGRMKSMLIDVDLKVQSSYQREHVPMISLMSKLNGKAIVGHPIPVETLENGSSDILMSAADDFQMEALDYDTALQPMRRTAKRSANSRVPRPPHLSSALDGEELAEHPQSVDQDKKLFGKSNAGNMSNKGSMMRKGSLSKPSRKQQKKINLSSSQKIRTLSSLGTQVKQRNDPKPHSCNGYQVDGLIKPESLPTTVACIPVKLVFSRLHEELVARHQ